MSKHVVVADEDPVMRRLIASVLALEQYEVHEADNGNEGLRLAKEVGPDLMVMDIKMPGMDGLEVCRRLKDCSDSVVTKVMIVTASESIADIADAASAGADAYLIKPFSIDNLRKRTKELLCHSQRNRTIG